MAILEDIVEVLGFISIMLMPLSCNILKSVGESVLIANSSAYTEVMGCFRLI